MMRDQHSVHTPATAGYSMIEEGNKAVVLDFIEKSVNRGEIDAASAHFGESYTQHNPNIAEGAQGFSDYLRQLRQSFPLVRGEVNGSSPTAISSSCTCTPGVNRKRPALPSSTSSGWSKASSSSIGKSVNPSLQAICMTTA